MRSGDWRRAVLAAVAAVAPLANSRGVELTGGLTAIGLFPTAAQIADDRTLSMDLNLAQSSERGRLLAYFEGNSSLDERRASTVLVESNADAGTALDPDRRGRVQLSELNYQLHRPGGRELTFGMLDASGYLDRTRITNDENVQFFGASFVNNPTIEFPDYTLGAVYQIPAAEHRPQINAVLTSSNGLADNPNLSYSQLFQVTDAGKGVFAAVGLGWPTETRLTRVGAWVNTREHADVNGSRVGEHNYGVYAVFGQSWRAHAMNVRVGLANDDVTTGSAFVALAYQYRLREHAMGVGVARAFLSRVVVDPLLDDSTHVEVFARLAIAPKNKFISAYRPSGCTTVDFMLGRATRVGQRTSRGSVFNVLTAQAHHQWTSVLPRGDVGLKLAPPLRSSQPSTVLSLHCAASFRAGRMAIAHCALDC